MLNFIEPNDENDYGYEQLAGTPVFSTIISNVIGYSFGDNVDVNFKLNGESKRILIKKDLVECEGKGHFQKEKVTVKIIKELLIEEFIKNMNEKDIRVDCFI